MINFEIEQINNAYEKLDPERERAYFSLNLNEKKEEIKNKYNNGKLYTYITYVEIGLLSLEDFKKALTEDLGIERETSEKIYTEVKENMDNLEKEYQKIKDFDSLYEEIKKSSVPTPPYAKQKDETIEEPISIENNDNIGENIYEKSGIEVIEDEDGGDVIIEDKDKEERREEEMLGNSGIDIFEEEKEMVARIDEKETEKFMMESIEHPESISKGILGEKLKAGLNSKTVVSDYSLPKINKDNSNSI